MLWGTKAEALEHTSIIADNLPGNNTVDETTFFLTRFPGFTTVLWSAWTRFGNFWWVSRGQVPVAAWLHIYTIGLFSFFYNKFLYLIVIRVTKWSPNDTTNICQVVFVLFLSLVDQLSCFIIYCCHIFIPEETKPKNVLCSGSRNSVSSLLWSVVPGGIQPRISC